MRDSHREFPVPWTKTGGQADEDINSGHIERPPKTRKKKTIYLLPEEEKIETSFSRVRRKILREGVN